MNLSLFSRRARKLLIVKDVLTRRRFSPLRDEWYSLLWERIARDLGGACDDVNGLTRIRIRNQETFVYHADLMLDDAITNRVMANKVITYRIMTEKNLPGPDYCVFTPSDMAEVEQLMSKHGNGLAIKPAAGTGGGLGVSTGVHTAEGLRKAARFASSFCNQLLAEAMLSGDCYRLLFLNGEYLHAVRRDRPSVTGDGRSSVKQLIETETQNRIHKRPLTALSPLLIDQDCRTHLRSQGISLHDVPKSNERITVKNVINENGAQDNHAIDDIHPEIIAAGEKLARDLNLGLAGLDVISQDISAPLNANLSVFHEINTSPGLHHHYLVNESSPKKDVAKQIIASMFETGRGIIQL